MRSRARHVTQQAVTAADSSQGYPPVIARTEARCRTRTAQSKHRMPVRTWQSKRGDPAPDTLPGRVCDDLPLRGDRAGEVMTRRNLDTAAHSLPLAHGQHHNGAGRQLDVTRATVRRDAIPASAAGKVDRRTTSHPRDRTTAWQAAASARKRAGTGARPPASTAGGCGCGKTPAGSLAARTRCSGSGIQVEYLR